MSNKKIAILFSGCYLGGFISSLTGMIEQLQQNGYHVSLYMYNQDQTDLLMREKVSCEIYKIKHNNQLWKYRLSLLNPSYFKYRFIQKDKVSQKQMEIISLVKNTVEELDLTEYDAVISWEEMQCNDYLALKVKARKKIAYIHPDYRLSKFNEKIDSPILNDMDYIVSVSEATTQTLREVFPQFKEKIKCVPNVLNTKEIDIKAKEGIETYSKSNMDIITVCRLAIYHKGLDRLMRVARKLEQDVVQYEWYICGDGEGKKELEEMIQDYHLEHVHLLGAKSNPYPYIQNADLFVLLSNYEGKPVVIDEAKYLNVPVFVTEYASAREQVVDGVNGIVVKQDEDDIYKKLKDLLLYPEKIEEMKIHLNQQDNDKYADISNLLEMIR